MTRLDLAFYGRDTAYRPIRIRDLKTITGRRRMFLHYLFDTLFIAVVFGATVYLIWG